MNLKVFLFTFVLLVSFASAADLTVNVLENDEIIITELDKSNATFKLQITNNGDTDDFQIYSLVSVSMYPKGKFRIDSGETIILDVTAVPFDEILRDKRGIYAFEYQIKGDTTGFFKEALAIRLFDVKDAVTVTIGDIPLNATEVEMFVNNREDVFIPGLKIVAKSNFFEFSETFDLNREQTKTFSVPIILEDKISAGDYEAEIIYELNDKKSSNKVPISYLESSGVSVYESTSGFIIKKTNITKSNEGNVPTTVVIDVRKNVFTRLFTVYSDRPTTSSRKGIFVDYSWEKELGVGESYTLTVKTNYTFPFIIILLVIIVGFFAKFIATKKLSVHKSVALVRTKGGELALKVNLRVKSRSAVRNVVISDRIPGHAKLFNKFGIPPHRIDEHHRKIEWDITQMNAGEERVFSYVIYSKINIVGSFELGSASVSFDHDGKREHVLSNSTRFAAETTEN
ncbi:hypothetical protein FJZ21_02245 [Candidatus Pacearchaeota archaeon]|nr:hypothetical protein [Candidatus Pacearchaeota archaeon]